MNMYVGNLNYRVKEGDLEQAMAAYGVVTSVKVIKAHPINQGENSLIL